MNLHFPSALARFFLLICTAASSSLPRLNAAEEVIPVAQDAFIKGAEHVSQVMPAKFLEVASRTLNGTYFEYVRKTFLRFDVDASLLTTAVSARVVLTSQTNGIIINDGEPRGPVELHLSGIPNAEWDEAALTWENAPAHDQQSPSDDGNPNLELLASASLDPLNVELHSTVTFSDPKLLEFLRKHSGLVTFLITSNGAQVSPGFSFYSKEGTDQSAHKPVLIIETK